MVHLWQQVRGLSAFFLFFSTYWIPLNAEHLNAYTNKFQSVFGSLPNLLLLCEEMNGKYFNKTKLLKFVNTTKRQQSKKIWFGYTWCDRRKQQPSVRDDTYLPNNAALSFQLFHQKIVKFISIGRERYNILLYWVNVYSTRIYLPVVVSSISFSV